MLRSAVTLFLASAWAHNYDDHPERYGRMLASHIIPDVIGAHMEMTRLNMSFTGVDGEAYPVEWGNEILPRHMVVPPSTCTWETVEYLSDSLLTLVLVGLDLPHRWNASEAEYQHWVVVNIPGNRVSAGDVLAQYQGPAPGPPPKGKAPSFGRHRFAAILFKQPEQIDVSDYKTITAAQVEPRKKFSTREFVVAHSLGLPVAVNFFEARHDKVTTEPAAAAHLGRNERSKTDSTEKAAKQKADDHSRPAAAAKKPGTKKATKKSKKKPPPGAPTVDASRTRADNSRADRPPVVETQQAQAKAPSDTKVEEIKEATVEASVGTDGDASMSTDAEAKNVLPVRMLQLLEDLDDELSPKESRLLRKMVRKGNKEVELAFLAAEKAASPKDQRRRFLRDAREILDEF